MKKTNLFLTLLFIVLINFSSKAQQYMCFSNDKNSSMQLSIYFDNDGNAKAVIYKGQTKWINLKFVRNIEENSGGAYPVISELYSELFNGKSTVTYKITKSGIWYYVVYKRKKDNKIFKFTIIEDTLNQVYTEPCF